jgi:uncharacterized membrane protein
VSRSPRALAAFFALNGSMHFVRPRAYEAIVPPHVPHAREVVVISGAAELVGALAALGRPTRGLARWWLLALLVAVFPANVHMALNPDDVASKGVPADRIPPWALWVRLPLQGVFMIWTWRATESR